MADTGECCDSLEWEEGDTTKGSEVNSDHEPTAQPQDSLQSGDDEECDCDFSYLPEPVWVEIMSYLPLEDQYHVSVTCHALYDIFNHPTNWKSACLHVVGGEHNFKRSKSFTTNRLKMIVEKFGHYFQRLTLSLSGHLVAMDESVREIVVQLAKVCRLEHLVLQVGLLTSDFHLRGFRPVRQDLKKIVQIVHNAFRLKKLEVVSWPMFPEMFDESEINVFEVMKSNPKLQSLESLSLFWMKDTQWSERSPLLPSPFYTTGLVAHFTCLQHLALRSPMLSDELLKELAAPSRQRLLSLQVLLQYSADSPQSVPDLQASSWLALREKSPRLEVEFAIMSRIPDIVLESMLMPAVPLATFRMLQYSRCSPTLVLTLCERFKTTLKSFICYCDPSDCGDELLKLVESCAGLHTLVFHGAVNCSTLLTIAQSRPHWRRFEYVEKSVVTEEEGDEFDEDTVVGRGNDGDLVVVPIARFHGYQTASERDERLSALRSAVSQRVDPPWRPK